MEVFVVGDAFGVDTVAQCCDQPSADAFTLVGGENGEIVDEEFGGFCSGKRQGVGGDSADDLRVGEGGDDPDVVAGEELVEVGEGEGLSLLLKDLRHDGEERGGQGSVTGAEPAGLVLHPFVLPYGRIVGIVKTDHLFVSERFPLASLYHPEWIRASVSGGASSLWLTEWLAGAMELRPGMRVLDLGCGKAASSIFLRREFGVEVWAVDLWNSASENGERVRDAGMGDGVFALRIDARALPFGDGFFDAVVSIDSYFYYGTDDLYLRYLARFVKPGGQIGMAGAGLMQEIAGPVPEHLRGWWTNDLWCLHSAGWWRRHWERSGIMEVSVADSMADGWRLWRDWHLAIAPDNAAEIGALEADQGEYLGYVRMVGRRGEAVELEEPIVSLPSQYTKHPLLRCDSGEGRRE